MREKIMTLGGNSSSSTSSLDLDGQHTSSPVLMVYPPRQRPDTFREKDRRRKLAAWPDTATGLDVLNSSLKAVYSLRAQTGPAKGALHLALAGMQSCLACTASNLRLRADVDESRAQVCPASSCSCSTSSETAFPRRRQHPSHSTCCAYQLPRFSYTVSYSQKTCRHSSCLESVPKRVALFSRG